MELTVGSLIEAPTAFVELVCDFFVGLVGGIRWSASFLFALLSVQAVDAIKSSHWQELVGYDHWVHTVEKWKQELAPVGDLADPTVKRSGKPKIGKVKSAQAGKGEETQKTLMVPRETKQPRQKKRQTPSPPGGHTKTSSLMTNPNTANASRFGFQFWKATNSSAPTLVPREFASSLPTTLESHIRVYAVQEVAALVASILILSLLVHVLVVYLFGKLKSQPTTEAAAIKSLFKGTVYEKSPSAVRSPERTPTPLPAAHQNHQSVADLEDLVQEYQVRLVQEKQTRMNLLQQASTQVSKLQGEVKDYQHQLALLEHELVGNQNGRAPQVLSSTEDNKGDFRNLQRQFAEEKERRQQANAQVDHLETELKESRLRIQSCVGVSNGQSKQDAVVVEKVQAKSRSLLQDDCLDMTMQQPTEEASPQPVLVAVKSRSLDLSRDTEEEKEPTKATNEHDTAEARLSEAPEVTTNGQNENENETAEMRLEKFQLLVSTLSKQLGEVSQARENLKQQLEVANQARENQRQQLEDLGASFMLLETQLLAFDRRMHKKLGEGAPEVFYPDPTCREVSESATSNDQKEKDAEAAVEKLATQQWIEEKEVLSKQIEELQLELKEATTELEKKEGNIQMLELSGATHTNVAKPEENGLNIELQAENEELHRKLESLKVKSIDLQEEIGTLKDTLNEKEARVEVILQNKEQPDESDGAPDETKTQEMGDLEFLKAQIKDQQLQIGADYELRVALQNRIESMHKEQDLQRKKALAEINELQDNLREEQQMHLETIMNFKRKDSAKVHTKQASGEKKVSVNICRRGSA